jgi:hypothetical protein
MDGIFWTTVNLDAAGEPLPQTVVSRHDYGKRCQAFK